jgi:hypothetical protein
MTEKISIKRMHGLQQGMYAESILGALARGEDIEEPVAKKRVRKKDSVNPF